MFDWQGVDEELSMTEKHIRNQILAFSRGTKQILMLGTDAVGLFVCIWVSTWLLNPVDAGGGDLIFLSLSTLIVTVLLAAHQGFYHSIVRYLGIDLAAAGVRVALLSAAMLAASASYFGAVADPLRLAVAYCALSVLYLLGSRFAARSMLNRRDAGRERVIVYGAGEAGARVVLAMQDGDAFQPVALIDDHQAVHGKRVGGLKVFSRQRLSGLINELDATRVLLALPSVSRRQRQEIIASLEPLNVHVQTIPDFDDLVSGKARVDDVRDVEVEDLLGREAVPPDEDLLRAPVAGKTVMITGAGGSIGSELCRQIICQKPKMIVLFEISEVALYNIDKEMQSLANQLNIECEIVALLGSVHHRHRVSEVMQTFEVNTVYHAAAYKHVPVVERNILEGVHNNVFGTLHTALAAIEANVETFVLVSTDKAVSPTNVMGATKRMAELVLQALQEEHTSMCFCMVRFGNVLESSGSVVPLFREQIRNGGPVTVTHPNIIRYFMTIPEAAQLVIQASGMASGGDVFVLDMGSPVRIQDLAHRMINLMGLTARDEDNPDGDIEILYTGLRPAEKLYEELLIGTDVAGTEHPRIMRANEEFIEYDVLDTLLDELKHYSSLLDRNRVRDLLQQAVNGYQPTNGIDDLVSVRTKTLGIQTGLVGGDFEKRSA